LAGSHHILVVGNRTSGLRSQLFRLVTHDDLLFLYALVVSGQRTANHTSSRQASRQPFIRGSLYPALPSPRGVDSYFHTRQMVTNQPLLPSSWMVSRISSPSAGAAYVMPNAERFSVPLTSAPQDAFFATGCMPHFTFVMRKVIGLVTPSIVKSPETD